MYLTAPGTVKTCLDHPVQGRGQMFRRGLSEKLFQKVLIDPRHHTGLGYQTKSSKYYKGK